MKTNLRVELAVLDTHGAWELIDDYATESAAKEAAREIASYGQYHIDDRGVMVFGITSNPDGSGYETRYCIEVDTGESWATDAHGSPF